MQEACDHLTLAASTKLASRAELFKRIASAYPGKDYFDLVPTGGSDYASLFLLIDAALQRLVDDGVLFRCMVCIREITGELCWRYHYNLAHLGHIRQRTLKAEMKSRTNPAPSRAANTELPCPTAPLPPSLPDSSSAFSGTAINPDVQLVLTRAGQEALDRDAAEMRAMLNRGLKAAATTTASRRSRPAKSGGSKRSLNAARSSSTTASKSSSRESARGRATR